MDINNALALLRAGKLPDCSLDDLRAMSAGSVVFIQNRIPDAVHLKTAIDDEIRRKEAQEFSDRLLHQTTKLVQEVVALTKFSEQQLQAAKILERYTRHLIFLTWALVGLTAGILVFTMALAIHEQRPQPQHQNQKP